MFGRNKFLAILIVVTVIGAFSGNKAFAALKDSDYDGLTDESETSVYKTDPLKSDTDGDSFSDAVEVIAKSNPLDSKITPVTVSEHRKLPLIERTDPFSWYISRISGIVAFILLTIVVLMGLVQTSKSLLKYKFMMPLTALETHRALAWSAGISVIIHFSSLLFDQVFQLRIFEALIPFQISRSFKSALGFDFKIPVSLGVFALYFIILLVSTSELRRKIVSIKVWRFIHFVSFITYLLFLVHAILSGTDSKEWWMVTIYSVSFLLVISMVLARIFRKILFYPKGVINDKTQQGPSEINKQQ